MGKPRDTKIAILPSTTRKGTTLSTSAALDSPSVIDKLVSPPHASRAGTSAESENSHNIDNVSAVLDDSGSLGSFLDATIAKSRQIENTETPNAATPVNSPESVDYSSDDLDEDYVELDNDFIEKCKATTDARKIKKLLAEHAVRYTPSPDPKFATSPINIRDKDYDFSLDLSHIAIVEKTPFCGTEKESAVEHLTELSTLSGVFSDDVKMRTYFVAKNFPFSLKDDAKTWYNNLPPGSIKSPTDLRDVFFRKYFPASAQHAALQRIYNFDQEDGEKLPEAWARFCSLIRAQPDHDLEKHDLLDIFYSGLTIESRAYLDSCAGCVFRKRTPDDAEELLAKIGRNHDDWSTPEPTPTPIVKKRGMIKLNDEDMREAKKSLKEKGIKPEDVKNLPPIEDICETIPPSSMIEYMKDIVTNKRKVPNEEISTMLANYSFNGKIPKKLGDPDKLIPTDISLQMADKSTAIPVGLCENVPVQVTQHCLILTDFVVLEMPEDDNMSIILGRPFLNTAGAVIDCNKGMVTFNVDDKEHTVYFPKRIDKDFKFNWSRSDPMVQYKIYNKAVNLSFSVFCAAIGVPQWGSCEKIRGTPRELSDLYTRICNGRSLSNDGGSSSTPLSEDLQELRQQLQSTKKQSLKLMEQSRESSEREKIALQQAQTAIAEKDSAVAEAAAATSRENSMLQLLIDASLDMAGAFLDTATEDERVEARSNVLLRLAREHGSTFWGTPERTRQIVRFQDRALQVREYLDFCTRTLSLVYGTMFPRNKMPETLPALMDKFRDAPRIHGFVRAQLAAGARFAMIMIKICYPKLDVGQIVPKCLEKMSKRKRNFGKYDDIVTPVAEDMMDELLRMDSEFFVKGSYAEHSTRAVNNERLTIDNILGNP
ncbi:hypothetical protein QYE76_040482 [Lolium multiflorum]|uniref:Retrotransposon gag domain-containing protein n=1 Tax=Lolium multiflorum TaxID=4521 RepID=A0AAD8TD47_LOLMU|nr:hypothetical protein QYE76_040482 [Lolium multiflorum]